MLIPKDCLHIIVSYVPVKDMRYFAHLMDDYSWEIVFKRDWESKGYLLGKETYKEGCKRYVHMIRYLRKRMSEKKYEGESISYKLLWIMKNLELNFNKDKMDLHPFIFLMTQPKKYALDMLNEVGYDFVHKTLTWKLLYNTIDLCTQRDSGFYRCDFDDHLFDIRDINKELEKRDIKDDVYFEYDGKVIVMKNKIEK